MAEKLKDQAINALRQGMEIPDETDVAFFATWISRRKNGSLTATACELKDEELTDEVKRKLAQSLRDLADMIERDMSKFKVV